MMINNQNTIDILSKKVKLVLDNSEKDIENAKQILKTSRLSSAQESESYKGIIESLNYKVFSLVKIFTIEIKYNTDKLKEFEKRKSKISFVHSSHFINQEYISIPEIE